MFKKPNKSGASSATVEKTKKDLDPYPFLFWIDQCLKPRSTKSNIPRINYESSESMEENEGVDDEDDKGSYPYMEQSAYVNERKRQLPQSRKNSASNSKLSRIEETVKANGRNGEIYEINKIIKEINDIIFKYQISKSNKSSGQQTFGMSIGINPLSYSERTRDLFSPFLKQTRENVSDRVLNAHYVPSQSNTSSLESPEYLLREPTNVSTPTSRY